VSSGLLASMTSNKEAVEGSIIPDPAILLLALGSPPVSPDFVREVVG
jgi:hypothetical protein